VSDLHALTVAAAATCSPSSSHIYSGCGFPAPSIQDFYFTPLFSIGSFHVDKSILIVFLSVVIVLTFFWFAFRKPSVVPRGAQNIAELGIFFVRDQILRPQLGVRGDKWLPFLTSLFFFIWINNIFGILPILYFPSMSKFAYPLALTIMVWLIYMYIGMKHQGVLGYFKNMAVPPGAPWWIIPLLAPLELLSNIFVRPFTLSVRLFANMLAGHVLLLVFTLGTWYLLVAKPIVIASVASFIVVILITALEVLIQALQAFIFATLTATYIAGSYEAAH
jgi:F-type H+-transporting ATPase subunit a